MVPESGRTRYVLPLMAAILGLATSIWAGYFYGPFGDDSKYYQLLAHNLVAGNGLSLSEAPPFEPSASRAPVYPIFLGLIYATLGDTREAVLIVQSLVVAIGCTLLTSLASILFNQKIAFVTCLMASLNPYLNRWAGSILTEALFITLIIGCIFVFTKALLTARTYWFACSGIMWSLATLCRPLTVMLLPLMVISIYLFSPKIKWRIWKAATVLLFGLITLSPWVVRNWIAFGRFMPLQSRAAGVNFWLTTLDPEDQPITDWVERPKRWRTKYPEFNQWLSAGTNTVAQQSAEKHLIDVALGRIAEHPLKYLISRMRSLPHLWLHSGKLWFSDISFQSAITSRRYTVLAVKILLFFILSFLPLVLALIGVYLSRRDWRKVFPLLLVPILIGFMHLPLWVEDRYGTPAVPFFLIFAAVALTNAANTENCQLLLPFFERCRIFYTLCSIATQRR